MPFPPVLAARLERLLDGVPRADLAVRAATMSAAYRQGANGDARSGRVGFRVVREL